MSRMIAPRGRLEMTWISRTTGRRASRLGLLAVIAASALITAGPASARVPGDPSTFPPAYAVPALSGNASFLGSWDPSPGVPWTVDTQAPDGSCTGTSTGGFTFTGCQVSGSHYEFTVESGGYSSYNHGTIEGDSLTGEFNDTLGHNVPYTAVREGGLSISISGAPSVALPETGTATEAFTVSLSEPSSEPVEVAYETEDGTATTADEDYSEESGTLTFAPGETSKEVDVTVDDGNGKDAEEDETYKVALRDTATPGATISPVAATATGTVTLPGFTGHSLDGKGKALPGATLTLTGRPDHGSPVTREVTTDASGAYTIAADPGEYSMYAHGVPPGQPAGLKWTPGAACPGKPSGAYCEKIYLTTYNGKLSAKVDFAYGAEDPEAENLEVMQAVQKSAFDAGGPQLTLPDGSKASSFSYSGVGLVSAGKTIVRLYGADNGALTAENVPAQLRAYSGSGSSLVELPGGPVAPLDNNLNLIEAPQFEADRKFSERTYNFVLPEAWTKTKGPITLVGTVDPEKKFVECPKCRDNDSVALTGVSFTEVPALKFIPMSLTWKQSGKTVAPTDPVAAVTRSWPYWPLPEAGLQAVGTPVSVDLTEALETVAAQLQAMPRYKGHPLGYQADSLVGCLGWNAKVKLNEACVNLIEPRLFAAEKAALPASAGSTVAVGVFNDAGLEYGVLGAANAIPGQFSYVPESSGRSAVVVHEMLHTLGFKHSGCTGPSDEEPWPANPQGQAALLGYGVNRGGGSSAGGIGGIYATTGTAAGQGWHDIMSYCEPTWPSAFNWERTLLRLSKEEAPKPFSSYPSFSGTASASSIHAARSGPVVTVNSINVAGVQTIADVEPGAHTGAGKASGYTFEALNSHGRVIAREPATAIDTHADVFEADPASDDEITILQVELPAKGLAGIALAEGKHVISTIRAPRGKLSLTVQRIARSACRRAGPLQLHFRARPGGGLFRRVRVLAVAGKKRRPIEVGSHKGTIVLKAGSRPKSDRKLIVELDDGFAAVTRAVNLPKGCRAG
jgi:Calx-beta domain